LVLTIPADVIKKQIPERNPFNPLRRALGDEFPHDGIGLLVCAGIREVDELYWQTGRFSLLMQ
jgi:hypothetical protein